ncbi:MAG: hypothetical protein HZC15_04920 [Candidatus Omnitrophica bacterium]|nr:hypothetical protein [Candidatus Omnitrophota bacterium]
MAKDRVKVNRWYFVDNVKATCASYLSTAKIFLDSSETICDKNLERFGSEAFKVVYYLIGHSLELNFKAFLLHKGYSENTLKRSFSHNLSRLSEEVKRNGLVILDAEDEKAINELNDYYSNKEIEYEKTDFELDAPWHYFDIIKKLLNEVKKAVVVII